MFDSRMFDGRMGINTDCVEVTVYCSPQSLNLLGNRPRVG